MLPSLWTTSPPPGLFFPLLPSSKLPADLELLDPERVKIHYDTLPGWQTDITKCKTFEELPENCKRYIEYIEKYLEVPIEWIGVGPGREAMIHRKV